MMMKRSRSTTTFHIVALSMLLLLLFNTVAASHRDAVVLNQHGYNQRRQVYGSGLKATTSKVQQRAVTLMHRFQPKINTSRSTTSISLLRGGTIISSSNNNNNETSLSSQSPPSESPSSWSRVDLAVFQSSSFFLVLSLALVAFSPAPALIAKIGSERATSTLSIIAACAAMTEIVISPVLGSLLDSTGRKPAMLFTLSCLAIVNGAVSIHSSVLMICIAKFTGMLCAGLFFIAAQVIITDISVTNPEQMSSTLGVQNALIGAAFFVGAIGAGRLSEFGLSITYATSTVVAALTVVLLSLGMRETLLPSKQIPFHSNKALLQKQLLQAPWSSCTKILFRHSKEVRILAILMMVQSLPSFMGDTFQILVKTEWNLETKDYSSFIAIFGIINIAANIIGSQMVVKLGIKHFTAIATLSTVLSSVGSSFFSFRGLIIGSIMGFLGSAQMLGVTAALYTEGAKSHVPQGELAGERSSFIALIKVIGPIWYSILYVKGKKVFGVGCLPFLFNIGLGMTAFGISQCYL